MPAKKKTEPVTGFNKRICNELADEIENALTDLLAPRGLRVEMRGGTFGGSYWKAKIEFAVEDAAEGQPTGEYADSFRWNAERFGLAPDDLGRFVSVNGRSIQIIGCRHRSPKYPILARDASTGKMYKYPASTIRAAIALEQHRDTA